MEDGSPPNVGVNQRGHPEGLAPGLTLLPKQQACRQGPEPPFSSSWALTLGRRRPQQKDRRTVDGRWLPLCPGHSSWPCRLFPGLRRTPGPWVVWSPASRPGWGEGSWWRCRLETGGQGRQSGIFFPAPSPALQTVGGCVPPSCGCSSAGRCSDSPGWSSQHLVNRPSVCAPRLKHLSATALCQDSNTHAHTCPSPDIFIPRPARQAQPHAGAAFTPALLSSRRPPSHRSCTWKPPRAPSSTSSPVPPRSQHSPENCPSDVTLGTKSQPAGKTPHDLASAPWFNPGGPLCPPPGLTLGDAPSGLLSRHPLTLLPPIFFFLLGDATHHGFLFLSFWKVLPLSLHSDPSRAPGLSPPISLTELGKKPTILSSGSMRVLEPHFWATWATPVQSLEGSGNFLLPKKVLDELWKWLIANSGKCLQRLLASPAKGD